MEWSTQEYALNNMLLFLIGLPGSGKTTLGKQLATALKIPFMDLDQEIVKRYQLSIEDIFKQKGEVGFREMERDTLRSLTDEKNLVVATGGGAACFHNNMEWMNTHGITLYLNPPLEELATRLTLAKNNHRPMLKNFSEQETLLFLKQKYRERNTYYQEAKIKLNTSSPTSKEILTLLTAEGFIPSL